MIKLTIIESPYAGDVEGNLVYARRACFHSMQQGETPFASHLLYPQFLNDEDPSEREWGIRAGMEWGFAALCAYQDQNIIFAPPLIAFYTDLGWSKGMEAALEHYTDRGMRCVIRKL